MKTLTPRTRAALTANSCSFESAETPESIGEVKSSTKSITKAKTYIFTYYEFLMHLGKTGQRIEQLQITSRQKNTVSPKCSFDSLFLLCHLPLML